MSKEQAMQAAREAATESGVPIVVVHAPIENAEDPEGPYGFCPQEAVGTLYRFAIQGVGQPDCPAQGIVANIKP